MKKFFSLLIILPYFAIAQDATLNIMGDAGNFYLNHIAAPKENYYSIGRLYNTPPKEIPIYNGSTMDKSITIGQTIKIPLKIYNFIQVNNVLADEVTIPVFHKYEAKETLYQLSIRYNKVPVATLKTWNNLKDDNVTVGQNIIVGYLKVKKELSALAQNTVAMGKSEPTKVKQKAIVKEPILKKEEEVAVIKEEPIKENKKPKVVIESKPAEPMVRTEPNNESNTSAKDYKGGIFKAMYSFEGTEDNGTAGAFKSLSGWQDGKYYCLYNKAQQHTIVKITNKANGKYIFAKVLDVMPDLKQNNTVQIRVSNAATEILGAGLNNFDCKIEY